MQIYSIIKPKVKAVPFVLSIPHSGVNFPGEIKESYNSKQLSTLDDTDWYLDQLYDFAPSLGITTIISTYSRWVIDLNRSPENKSLYNDGRIITDLCPKTNFLGEDLYKKKNLLNSNEVQKRIDNYYWPYHHKIHELIDSFKNQFNEVLFWDAHSIRRKVSTIRKEPFPDFIIGDNNEKTADKRFIDSAINQLKDSTYEVKHNHPFKGGYLTRSIGNPSENIHALQLEMSKDLYMSNNETEYDSNKAAEIKKLLIRTFQCLIAELK